MARHHDWLYLLGMIGRSLDTEERRKKRDEWFDSVGRSIERKIERNFGIRWSGGVAEANDPKSYTRKEYEPLVAGSLLAAQLLARKAENERYPMGPHQPHLPGLSLQFNDTGSTTGRPYTVELSRKGSDGETLQLGSVTIETTAMRSLSKLQIDKDKDGIPDLTITANRDKLGNANSLELDTNKDGKADAYLVPEYEFGRAGYIRGLGLRAERNGYNTAYIDFTRDNSSYISEIGLDTDGDSSVEQYLKVERNQEGSMLAIR